MSEYSISKTKLEAIRLEHRQEEDQALAHRIKLRPSPFNQISSPKRLADVFISPSAKAQAQYMEDTRLERGLPLTMADMPFEQVKRIWNFVDDHNKKSQASENANTKFSKMRTAVEFLVEQGHSFK